MAHAGGTAERSVAAGRLSGRGWRGTGGAGDPGQLFPGKTPDALSESEKQQVIALKSQGKLDDDFY